MSNAKRTLQAALIDACENNTYSSSTIVNPLEPVKKRVCMPTRKYIASTTFIAEEAPGEYSCLPSFAETFLRNLDDSVPQLSSIPNCLPGMNLDSMQQNEYARNAYSTSLQPSQYQQTYHQSVPYTAPAQTNYSPKASNSLHQKDIVTQQTIKFLPRAKARKEQQVQENIHKSAKSQPKPIPQQIVTKLDQHIESSSIKNSQASSPTKNKVKRKDYESDNTDSSDEDGVVVPPVDESTLDFHQQQPIRVLAFQLGLSKNPAKVWRYRDIKRSLFDKAPKEQINFIESIDDHTLLKQRLPHKLSLCAFAKRIMLLVFHFIVRDGREPKFWRKGSVNKQLMEKILKEHESEFFEHINIKAAFQAHSYMIAGMNLPDAIAHQKKHKELCFDV
jgi:hypothetical protein